METSPKTVVAEKATTIYDLPLEALDKICSYLNSDDLTRLQLTCSVSNFDIIFLVQQQ